MAQNMLPTSSLLVFYTEQTAVKLLTYHKQDIHLYSPHNW